jgi:hypothetical protein
VAFLTSALDGGEWSASRTGRFTTGEIALGTYCTESCVGPTSGLDAAAKKVIPIPAGIELRSSTR